MKPSITLLLGALAAAAIMSGPVPAGAAVPSAATLAAAKTPADHQAIANAYLSEARSLEKLAVMHRELARIYSAPGGKPWEAAQARHCRQIVAELSAAAKAERDLAAEHEKRASSLAK